MPGSVTKDDIDNTDSEMKAWKQEVREAGKQRSRDTAKGKGRMEGGTDGQTTTGREETDPRKARRILYR